MADFGRYDSDIQMFVEPPRPVDFAHLRYLRWLAERECLEHAVCGRPTGEYASYIQTSEACE